jgi:hypothetical protein
VEARERLDGDVGDAEQHARRAAEHDAVVVVGAPMRGPVISSAPIASSPASKAIMPASE